MTELLTGAGPFYGSFALVVICLVCAVLSIGKMAGFPRSLKQIGMWLISAGWLVLFARLLIPIVGNQVPDITPAGQISLALLGAGTIFYILGDNKP